MAEVDEKPKRRSRWPFLFAALVLFGFVGIVLAIVLTPSPNVWTDDAYVEVHTTAVAPQIAGRFGRGPGRRQPDGDGRPVAGPTRRP